MIEARPMYLTAVSSEKPSAIRLDEFPWTAADLPLAASGWSSRAPVTFLVGENGSGKSTLLEGLAAGMQAAGRAAAPRSMPTTSLAHRAPLCQPPTASRAAGMRPRARCSCRAEDLFGFVRSALASRLQDI